MRYCQDKDINRLVAEMVRSGWNFDRGRHGKLYHPAGQGFITIPKTPSDRRSLLNIKRDIRRVEGKALGEQSKNFQALHADHLRS